MAFTHIQYILTKSIISSRAFFFWIKVYLIFSHCQLNSEPEDVCRLCLSFRLQGHRPLNCRKWSLLLLDSALKWFTIQVPVEFSSHHHLSNWLSFKATGPIKENPIVVQDPIPYFLLKLIFLFKLPPSHTPTPPQTIEEPRESEF